MDLTTPEGTRKAITELRKLISQSIRHLNMMHTFKVNGHNQKHLPYIKSDEAQLSELLDQLQNQYQLLLGLAFDRGMKLPKWEPPRQEWKKR